jgi:hypothetical protein
MLAYLLIYHTALKTSAARVVVPLRGEPTQFPNFPLLFDELILNLLIWR